MADFKPDMNAALLREGGILEPEGDEPEVKMFNLFLYLHHFKPVDIRECTVGLIFVLLCALGRCADDSDGFGLVCSMFVS